MTTERIGLGRRTLLDQSLRPLQASDKFGAIVRWFMAQDHVRQNLKIPETSPEFNSTVARELERLMYRGENTSHGMELTGALALGRSNVFFAPMAIFTSSVSKIYSSAVRSEFAAGNALRAARGGNPAVARAEGRKAVAALSGFTGAIVWAGLVREVLRSARGKVDDGIGERAVKRLVSEGLGGVPLIGDVVSSVASQILTGDSGKIYEVSLLEGLVKEGSTAVSQLVGASQALIEGELTAEGELAGLEKLEKAAIGATRFIATLKGIPIEGPEDLVRISKNLLGGETPSARKILSDALGETQGPDLTQERRRVLASIKNEDDQAFRRAVESLPEDKRFEKDIERILRGRYSRLLNVDRRVELDAVGTQALEDLRGEFEDLERSLDNLLRRNPDLFGRSGGIQ